MEEFWYEILDEPRLTDITFYSVWLYDSNDYA